MSYVSTNNLKLLFSVKLYFNKRLITTLTILQEISERCESCDQDFNENELKFMLENLNAYEKVSFTMFHFSLNIFYLVKNLVSQYFGTLSWNIGSASTLALLQKVRILTATEYILRYLITLFAPIILKIK